MKQLIFVIVFIVSSHLGVAQSQSSAKTLLWKITGNGIQQPSFIFGSFHLLCADDLILPDTLTVLLEHTRRLYFELNLDDPSMNQKMMASLAMKDQHQLKEFIPAAEYTSLDSIFQSKTHLPFSVVGGYKPFVLASFLYPSMLGCSPVSVEQELDKKAHADAIPVFGLESVEFQMSLFDTIPYAEQAKMLQKNLISFDQCSSDLQKLIGIYKQKDLDLLSSSVSLDEDLGKYDSLLLNKRNEKWVPLIAAAAAEKPSFFVVGAGHLGGTDGVLNLLRKANYTISPVMY